MQIHAKPIHHPPLAFTCALSTVCKCEHANTKGETCSALYLYIANILAL